ncbi:hypothetical protein ACFZAD_06285 [Streptomyces iakyrus]|uniref:hypothetical protein n=1 Tax=Streptomyces iakyrus TaxID=68219 RepID=UPI0036E3C691
MTAVPRRRFTVRAGLAAAVEDGPYEGVPGHLRRPLRAWLEAQLGRGEIRYHPDQAMALRVCLRLRMEVSPSETAADRLLRVEDDELLDVVDELLAHRADKARSHDLEASSAVIALNLMLSEGGSAYRVGDDLDCLETRIMPAADKAVKQTISDTAGLSATGSAAAHLTSAWKAAYGRHPDPVRAYSEAIKAVESAAHATIEPNNTKATLGTMLRVMRNSPSRFTTVLPTPVGQDPIAHVIAMMRALWEGQTSRHGTRDGTVAETLEAARAGVHLAATLVQWFASAAVARTP